MGAACYIEVRPTGAKLWRYKYLYRGKEKRIALGAYPDVGLADARRKSDEARTSLANNRDPLAERKRDKLNAAFAAANTFSDIAKEYIDRMVAEGRADTTTTKANWILEQLKPIAGFPISDLKSLDVLSALKRLEARGNMKLPVAATRSPAGFFGTPFRSRPVTRKSRRPCSVFTLMQIILECPIRGGSKATSYLPISMPLTRTSKLLPI